MELASLSKDGKIVHSHGDASTTARGIYPTNFVSTIDEWITAYGNSSSPLKETFIDADGVERYKDNWRTASVSGNPSCNACTSEEVATTGCSTVAIRVRESSVEKHSSNVRHVNFMLNFRALWDYNEKDNSDEITDYSPLFRVYIELFFHKRTVQLMLVLSVYFISASVICDSVYVISPPISRTIWYFNSFLQTIVYFALVALLKGSLFSPNPPKKNGAQEKETVKENDSNYYRSKQSLNWIYYFKQAMHLSAGEVTQLYFRPKNARKSKESNREAQKIVPFYETLNIGLKFLTKHSKHTGEKLNLDNPRHNYKLLFIFFAVPAYVLITTYASPLGPYQLYMEICKQNGWDSIWCKNFNLLFLATLGYSIPVVVKILFISSMLLALVSLSLGAEIGCAMVDSWILRFGSLRTLREEDAAGQDSLEAGLKKTGKGTTKAAAAAPAKLISPPAGVVNALHAIGAAPSGHLAVPPNHGEVISAQSPEVLIYLQRDAYEHYLYVREYMNNASKAWSFTIIAFIFLAAFFIMLFMYSAIANATKINDLQWTYYAFWVTIRISLLAIYPIVSLARANAYVYALQEQFLVAAPEDFAVIGGRDSWLEYLDKVPAMWTIYGLTITWDRLSGLLWTGVAGVGAIAISSVASSR